MTKQGNTNALKHGGEAAVKDLANGEDFHGPAIVAQVEAHELYSEKGADFMLQRGAVRLQAAADLYFDAILIGSQNGASIAVLDGYFGRWGWLQNSALRAWAEVGKHDAKKNAQSLDAVLGKDND
jgi:hypothetical protein